LAFAILNPAKVGKLQVFEIQLRITSSMMVTVSFYKHIFFLSISATRGGYRWPLPTGGSALLFKKQYSVPMAVDRMVPEKGCIE
jgi:hypothetical protein